MKEISILRSKLPAGAKAMVVKNTLLERAVGDSFDLGSHSELSAGVNLWFFVPQDDMRGVLEAYGDWAKKTIPKEKRDDVVVKGGFFEGDYQDAAGVAALEKLPTKLELIQKIAVSLKMAGAQGIAVSTLSQRFLGVGWGINHLLYLKSLFEWSLLFRLPGSPQEGSRWQAGQCCQEGVHRWRRLQGWCQSRVMVEV